MARRSLEGRQDAGARWRGRRPGVSRCPLMTLTGHGPEIQWQPPLCPESPVPCHTVPWWPLRDPQAVVFTQGILFGTSLPDGSPRAVPRQGAVPQGKRVGLAGAAARAEDTHVPGALVLRRLRGRSRRRRGMGFGGMALGPARLEAVGWFGLPEREEPAGRLRSPGTQARPPSRFPAAGLGTRWRCWARSRG